MITEAPFLAKPSARPQPRINPPLHTPATPAATPLIELDRFDAGPCRLFAKLEYLNPTGSIKDRVAPAMIAAAEQSGTLRPGMTIVEGSSGNATIAIGAIARRRGYKVIAFVPESMSAEKKALHRALGVECRFMRPDPANPFTNPRRDAALALAASDPGTYVCLDQFSNPANVLAHETTTGEEIWHQANDLHITIDRYFAGAGTGGSVVGIARALARPDRFHHLALTLVDPDGSTLAARKQHKDPEARFQDAPDGIGERFIPANLDMSVVSDAVTVARRDAIAACVDLVRRQGILAGPCSGYTLHAALKWARTQTDPTNILVLVCDRGENYLSDPAYAQALDGAFDS